jgi:RNA polymerase sigma factor for flagellar operon FliA
MVSLDEPHGTDDDGSGSLAGQVPARDSAGPGDHANDRERLERLTKAIAELPETDRHVIVLYFHEQLFLKEIGQLLGVTESRISQILTRATERLRQKLKEPE